MSTPRSPTGLLVQGMSTTSKVGEWEFQGKVVPAGVYTGDFEADLLEVLAEHDDSKGDKTSHGRGDKASKYYQVNDYGYEVTTAQDWSALERRILPVEEGPLSTYVDDIASIRSVRGSLHNHCFPIESQDSGYGTSNTLSLADLSTKSASSANQHIWNSDSTLSNLLPQRVHSISILGWLSGLEEYEATSLPHKLWEPQQHKKK